MLRAGIMLTFAWLLCVQSVSAGTVYKVTSKQGNETKIYEVQFGGGKLNDRYTAFDPESKKFVHLEWKRDSTPPVPAMSVWDHRTGETIPLYTFPNAKHPLPVIPTIKAMQVCPLTGDKNFTAEVYIFID